jgi:hypothetical protein
MSMNTHMNAKGINKTIRQKGSEQGPFLFKATFSLDSPLVFAMRINMW